MTEFSISIEQVVDLLGLERSTVGVSGSSFNVKCPFHADKGYHMNINTQKNSYHCVICDDSANTGVLDLFSRVRLGVRATKGENTKKIYSMLMKELGQASGFDKVKYAENQRSAAEYQEIRPADDEHLNEVYTALLKIPYLKLTSEHKTNLLNRGLTEEDIEINGYASVSEYPDFDELCESQCDMPWYRELDVIIKDDPILKRYSVPEVIFGMSIARELIQQGLDLANVPGFYKINGKWSFRSVEKGILIPTRNAKGQIVGLQTRLDEKKGSDLRYMTVSAKGLTGGVSTGISRVHFTAPLSSINESTRVILTEGPLKADVSVSLFEKIGKTNILIIALQGVNSTRDLPQIAHELSSMGIKKIHEAFDMDKIINTSVGKAQRKIRKIFHEAGISVKSMYWDREYAEMKESQLTDLCEKHDIPVEEKKNVYESIISMSEQLEARNIEYRFVIDGDGNRHEEKWRDEMKGLDDYLKTLQSR